jgi:hypothetical protein
MIQLPHIFHAPYLESKIRKLSLKVFVNSDVERLHLDNQKRLLCSKQFVKRQNHTLDALRQSQHSNYQVSVLKLDKLAAKKPVFEFYRKS